MKIVRIRSTKESPDGSGVTVRLCADFQGRLIYREHKDNNFPAALEGAKRKLRKLAEDAGDTLD